MSEKEITAMDWLIKEGYPEVMQGITRDSLADILNRYIHQYKASHDKGEEDRWISVDDRLPEDEDEVLGCHIEAGGITIIWYDIELKKWHFDSEQKGMEILITHWQPLPNPPTEYLKQKKQ